LQQQGLDVQQQNVDYLAKLYPQQFGLEWQGFNVQQQGLEVALGNLGFQTGWGAHNYVRFWNSSGWNINCGPSFWCSNDVGDR
jgi:hypothetical protein